MSGPFALPLELVAALVGVCDSIAGMGFGPLEFTKVTIELAQATSLSRRVTRIRRLRKPPRAA